MFAFYRTRGISLLEKLNQLYAEYGTCLNTLYSYEFAGVAGFSRMQDIMATLRAGLPDVAGRKVEQALDYSKGIDGLPKSDVLKYYLAGNCSVVVRPSGTEPKIKIYLSVSAKDRDTAQSVSKELIADLEKRLSLK
jgi:phosphoglucomutase